MQYLDRLLEANPWRARTWLQKSHVLNQVGRSHDALAACRRALEVDPTLVDAYLQAANLCRRGLVPRFSAFPRPPSNWPTPFRIPPRTFCPCP